MKVHKLKLKELYFEDVNSGKKPFEIRLNDRDYQVGDLIEFRKVNNDGSECKGSHLRGNLIFAEIPYLIQDTDFLKDGYCSFGIKLLDYMKFFQKKKEINIRT